MLNNYFKIAVRSLKHRKVYTLINVLGLGMGIACALLIFTLVRFHLSFDAFHSGKDRVYRIITEDHLEQIVYSPGVPPPVGKAFREDYAFAEKVARVYTRGRRMITLPSAGDRKFKEEEGVAFAEPAFFDILDFPLIQGDQHTILTEPNTALVTERLAKKYFSGQDPIGKIIRLDNRLDFRITGILRDLPVNTDRRQEIYLPYSNLKDHNSWAANDDNWLSYADELQCFILLKPGVSPAAVNAAFPAFSSRHYEGDYAREWQFRLQPLSDIHFNSLFDGKISGTNLWALSLIGVFLVITAAVNFINLATAQALSRSKEVGIRKALGSIRRQLFWQFITETAVIVLVAMLFALVLTYWMLPFFNQVFDVSLHINFFRDIHLLLFLPMLLLTVIFLSGAYPSLIMAGFQPVQALKGKLSQKHAGGFSLRRGLVITQFAISQLLIIGTLVIAQQIRYSRQADMGFNKDAIVMLPLPGGERSQKINTLQSELSRITGVEKLSFCNQPPASKDNSGREIVYDARTEKENYDVNFKAGDEQYVPMFGLTLLAGRNLYPSDTTREYLVNETLVKRLGVSIEAVIGKNAMINDVNGTIVGVIKDFHNQSFHTAIDPLCITTLKDNYSTVAIKLNTAAMSSALSAVEKVWRKVYPDNIYQHEFLDERIARFYQMDQKILQLIQTFTIVAILIACLGLYGLVSFMASQKTREVGVRKVLGASVQSIVWLFGKEFVRLLFIAFVIAAPLAWWVMNNWLENFAYRIGIGPQIFLLAVLVSLATAILPVGYRAVKAALMNPVKSLRSD